jgi:LacI family transcriptional regulator
MAKQRITIHDIAKELNITASTVSRALHDHPRISKDTKDMVMELAQKLNYQPNSVAASLRMGRGNTIGVIIPQIDRNFFSSVIRGLEDVSYEAGFNVLICQSYNSWEREKSIVAALTNGKIDGLMVSLATGTKNYDHFQATQNKGFPLIFFDRVPDIMDVNKVEVDDFSGAHMAVDHLYAQGCKRIACFMGPQHVSIYRNRFEGYKAALQKNGLLFEEELVFHDTITRDTGEQAAVKINKMKQLPDGLFSASDFSALGAHIKFRNLGLHIPKDIAIVGFANETYDDMLEPGLSSVDQHSIEIGRSVAKLFLEGISDPKSISVPKRIILNTELQIRGSSLKNKS